jgi:hypothetical protein
VEYNKRQKRKVPQKFKYLPETFSRMSWREKLAILNERERERLKKNSQANIQTTNTMQKILWNKQTATETEEEQCECFWSHSLTT